MQSFSRVQSDTMLNGAALRPRKGVPSTAHTTEITPSAPAAAHVCARTPLSCVHIRLAAHRLLRRRSAAAADALSSSIIPEGGLVLTTGGTSGGAEEDKTAAMGASAASTRAVSSGGMFPAAFEIQNKPARPVQKTATFGRRKKRRRQ